MRDDIQILKSARTSSTTIYILNLDLSGNKIGYNINDNDNKPIQYAYRSGYSYKDLLILSKDENIKTKSREILLNFKRSSKLDLNKEIKSSTNYPLNKLKWNFTSSDEDERIFNLKFKEKLLEDEDMNVGETTSLSDSSSELTHSRDAVYETSSWVDTYSTVVDRLEEAFDKDTMSNNHNQVLIQRANSILSLQINEDDSNAQIYSHRKYSLALSIIHVINSEESDFIENNLCSTDTWVTRNRAIWTDLHAMATPPIELFQSISSASPLPREITEQEWLQLGANAKAVDPFTDVDKLRQSIERQIKSSNHLLVQLSCKPLPELGTGGLSNPYRYLTKELSSDELRNDKSVDNYVSSLNDLLNTLLSRGQTSESCALLHTQIGLFNITLVLSNELIELSKEYKDIDSENEFIPHLNKLASFHVDLLISSLELSKVLLESSAHIHSNQISEQIVVYLSHLSGAVKRISRYFITPPMNLYFNNNNIKRKVELSDKDDTIKKDMFKKNEVLSHVTKHPLFNINIKTGSKVKDEPISVNHTLHEYIKHHFNPDNDSLLATDEEDDLYSKTYNKLWLSLLPGSIISTRIEVIIYVIKTHNTYKPIATTGTSNEGFDYWSVMKEIERLKLPNQQMTITMHEINAIDEDSISLSLKSCLKYKKVNNGNMNDIYKTRHQAYLDSNCFWDNLQHLDEQNSGILDEYDSDKTQHVPIFVLSLDNPIPVYIDSGNGNLLQAVNLGNAVVIIQNKQEKIPTSLYCDKKLIYSSGKNPLSATLVAIGQLIGGLSKSQIGHCNIATSDDIFSTLKLQYRKTEWNKNYDKEHNLNSNELLDYTSYLGESPVFQALSYSHPTYSLLDIEFIHRSRIMKSLSLSRHIITIHKDLISRSYINQINQHFNIAIKSVNSFQWDIAAAHSNEVFILVMKYTNNDNLELTHKHHNPNERAKNNKEIHSEFIKAYYDIVENLINFGFLIFTAIISYFISKYISSKLSKKNSIIYKSNRNNRGNNNDFMSTSSSSSINSRFKSRFGGSTRSELPTYR
jgi:hypothetical protein